MSTGETVVNSYDSGQNPYNHDPKRGKWEGRWDFYFACFANAFGMRTFFMFASFMQIAGEVYIIIPVMLFTFLYIIPVFFVQSFMGQFSSTGFISVFRISPLFKGVGFLILIMNYLSGIYSSSLATFPLLFFLKSFQRNTTWMYCNNEWNTANCSEKMNRSVIYPYDDFNLTDSMDPIYEYFYGEVLKFSHDKDAFNISWPIILGAILVWAVTCHLIYRGVSMISRYLRYTIAISVSISIIIFLRTLFLPEAVEDSAKFVSWKAFTWLGHPQAWIAGPFISGAALGRGWGIILTLASFQPFKANAERSSYIIPVSSTFVSLIFGYMIRLIDGFIFRRSIINMKHYHPDTHEYLFIAFPYFFGKIEWSQFWSTLFFFKLFAAELALIVIQAFATMTALTDEYVNLRNRKPLLAVGICASSFLASCFFATNNITEILKPVIRSTYTNKILICLLEILVVVWIYGRLRFIRDVRFMLVKNVSSWKFYIIRFATPLCAALTGFFYVVHTLFPLIEGPFYVRLFIFVTKVLPWIVIPVFIISKLSFSNGSLKERFRRCTQPNDWYPADAKDKQKYELAFGVSNLSQQLIEMNENNSASVE